MNLVECYSGGQYAEDPRAITWEGQRLVVIEILGCWRTPSGKRFLVRTDDDRLFTLAYDENEDHWKITEG